MKIIVDAMGGDNAPGEIVRGALDAYARLGTEILLVGRVREILEALEACGQKELPAGVEIRNATEVVEIADDPATAFRRKKDSSLTVGLTLLRDGEGDAFVSAGSTGAILAGATLLVKRIRGIRRAAMAPQVPCAGGRMVLCDCGANAECTAEYLLQFAFLGSFYAKRIMGIESPRVGLLNIGTEEEKGDQLRHEALRVLQSADAAGCIRFIGSVEASAAMMGGADVVVADGFSGNVMLKSVEGTAKFLGGEIKKMFLEGGAGGKVSALLMKEKLRAFRALLDPGEVGGTPFLGVSKPVIKAHGSSDAKAICSAIRQAKEFTDSGFIGEIEQNVEYMKVSDDSEKVEEKA